jgi:cytochrome P450 family 117 subfamily A
VLNPFARAPLRRKGLPVAPGGFPLVGHLPALYRDLPGLFRRSRAELGPLFWVALGRRTWLLVCSGAAGLDVLQSPAFSSTHLQRGASLIAGRSVLAQDGEVHRRMRGAMRPPFLPRGLTAGKVAALMANALVALTERWLARGKARVLSDVQEVTIEIMFRMLGVGLADVAAWRVNYRELLLSNLGIDVDLPLSPMRRAARARAWIDAELLELVRRARSRPDDESLLATLARATDEQGRGLADDELVDNLRLLVLAGHETISATLAWIVLTLGTRGDLWRALQEEVPAAAEVPTTPEEARRFPFAEGLFRETVRMHPPFSVITRITKQPVVLHDREIPTRTVVAADLWGIGRDLETFVHPEEVLPSRWMGRHAPPSPIEVSQFGAGSHFCLGYHVAWLEAVQFIVALVRTMGRAGRRPLLSSPLPRPIFVPTEHPPASVEVTFARA